MNVIPALKILIVAALRYIEVILFSI